MNTHSLLPRTILAVLLAFVLSGCGPSEKQIVIVSTNDVHAAIDKFPKLAYIVDSVRQKNPGRVLLVDAGDRWTGNPFVDLAEEPGLPIIQLMDSLGYDLATMGNHEFDRGLAHLDSLTKQATFPVILANIDTKDSPLTQPKPYVFKTVDGVKFGFIGLITNFINGHPDGDDDVFEGVGFSSPYDAAEAYRLLADSCDVLVAVTHIGDDADSVLAGRVPAIDLIIGGHTHVAIPTARVYGKTHVTQTGKSLKNVGITTITLKGDEILSIENHLLPLNDSTPTNRRFQRMVDRYNDNPALKKAVGSLAEPLDKQGAANLVTDVIRNSTKADMAFYHLGGIRVNGLPAGQVSIADIFALEPFESRIRTTKLTPDEIKTLIIDKYNDTQNPKESHRRDIYPSGITYTIVTDQRGEAVDVVFGGKKLSPKRKYRVSMPDYMYNVYKFEKRGYEEKTPLLTDLMIEYFNKKSPVGGDNTTRIEIERR